jgi:hypothetical protein
MSKRVVTRRGLGGLVGEGGLGTHEPVRNLWAVPHGVK